MPHWSCSSVLCFNNHQAKDGNGGKMRKYRLPTDSDNQAAYARLFKITESFNWKPGFICNAHSVLLPPDHFETLKNKYQRAKSMFTSAAKPTQMQRRTYQKAEEKFEAAKKICKSSKAKNCRQPPKSRPVI